MRLREVLQTTGLSRTTIWRLQKKGAFPEPVRLSERAIGWKAEAIEAWLQSRPAA